MTYARFITNDSSVSEDARAEDAIREAYQLRERASEREQPYIVSHHESDLTRKDEGARNAWQPWAQSHPRDNVPPANCSVSYTNRGEYDKARAAADQKAIDPDSGRRQLRPSSWTLGQHRDAQVIAAIALRLAGVSSPTVFRKIPRCDTFLYR